MERTLFSVLSLFTLGLVYTSWVQPGATDELFRRIGISEASAQTPGGSYQDPQQDPKKDPFNQLPHPIMPTMPTSPVRPASWAGAAPNYAEKYGATPPPDRLAANGPLFGPPPVEGAGTPTSPTYPNGTNPIPGGNPPVYVPPIYTPPTPAPGLGYVPGSGVPSLNPGPSVPAGGNPAPSNSAPTNYAPPASAPVSPPFNPPAVGSMPLGTVPPVTYPPVAYPPVAGNSGVVAAPAQGQLLTAGQILARIGSDVIVAGDVMPTADEQIAAVGDKIPASQVEEQRKMLMQRMVMGLIETKLLCADAKRTIPAANYPKVEENLGKEFEKSRLKEMMKTYDAKSNPELDEKLRIFGSSLDKQKKMYIERMIAMSWMQQQLKSDEDIRRDDLLAYFKEHHAEYEFKAKARWEHIMVSFDKFPSKADAYRAIAEWGNDVVRGIPLAEVAKVRSQDLSASKGGLHDWTTRGSIVSDALDQAIFSLPVGGLSQIIEDAQAFHIVRVVERKDAGATPFEDLQTEIRKKIKQEKRDKQVKEYIAKLRERTPVSTIWDTPAESGPQLSSRPESNPR